jgi:hypothetical protein
MLRRVAFLLSAPTLAVLGTPDISIDHSLPCQIYPVTTFTAGDKLQFQSVASPYSCLGRQLMLLADLLATVREAAVL